MTTGHSSVLQMKQPSGELDTKARHGKSLSRTTQKPETATSCPDLLKKRCKNDMHSKTLSSVSCWRTNWWTDDIPNTLPPPHSMLHFQNKKTTTGGRILSENTLRSESAEEVETRLTTDVSHIQQQLTEGKKMKKTFNMNSKLHLWEKSWLMHLQHGAFERRRVRATVEKHGID